MKKRYEVLFKTLNCVLFILLTTTKSFSQVPACTPSMNPISSGTLVSPSTPFTWTAPTGTVTGYRIYIGTTNAATELVNGTVITSPSTSYTYNGTLSCGTTYYWKVVPYNGSGPAVGCSVLTFSLTAPGDPTVFPIGSWNAYCYNSLNYTNYTGYYTSTGQDFNSTTTWNTNNSPSSVSPNGASTYQGCSVPNDNHCVIYKRQGFTPGTYSLNVLNDDGCVLYLNGVSIYSRTNYTPSFINGVWTGNLDASSQIEFRWNDTGGGSSGGVTFNAIATPTLSAGTISGDQILCSGSDPYIFASTAAASGVCSSTISYQWQQDVGCTGTFLDIVGATTATYDVPAGITATTCYVRKVTDANCGRSALTNTVTVTITAVQQGDPTIYPANTWNGYVFDFTSTGYTSTDDNWTVYKGFYSYSGVSASDPGFNTTTFFRIGNTPSSVSTYAGCQVAANLSGVQMKRQGFPVGTYQIDFNSDDAGYLYINGVLVYSRTGCCAIVSNVWTGNLDATSTIDYHYKNNGSAALGSLTFTLVPTPTPLSEGAIALSGPSSICSGNTPSPIVSTVAATSSCFVYYQWQADSTGTGYVDIVGATSAAYAPPVLIQSTLFRRKATDACGDIAYSNIVGISTGPSTPPDPSIFGNNSWIAYAYNAQNFAQLYGSYADPGASSTDPSFYSGSLWALASAPSTANTYIGCQVGVDNHSVIYKRQGFTTGTYSLSVTNDDACSLYINGVLVYSRGGAIASYINAVWVGNLDPASKIEFRWTEGGGNSFGGITFVQIATPSPLVGGTIANATSSVCSGDTPTPFTVATMPTGGCSVAAYQWQSSTTSTSAGFSDISGATLSTYAPAALTTTTYYQRKVTDACSQIATSNVVTITVTTPIPPNPAIFGSNVWNVYAYNDVTYTTLRGSYVDNGVSITDPSFDSRNIWSTGVSPSYAVGYSGCQVVLDQHGVIYKRQGFPAGTYRLDYNSDDAGAVYIDGVLVYTSVSWGTLVTNIWTGALTATSTIEYRWADTGGSVSYGSLLMTQVSITPLLGGTIANNNTAVCSGNTPAAFTSAVDASGGCYFAYQWQSSTTSASAGFSNISGATLSTYASGALTSTTYYRRNVTDICSNNAVSNVVTIAVTTPATPSTTFGSGGWSAYVYNARNSFITANLFGKYTEPNLSSGNYSFDTRNSWPIAFRPSIAAGYTGCQVGNNAFGISFRQTGFVAGTYQIDIEADDDAVLIIDGVTKFTITGSNGTPQLNVGGGPFALTPASQIEIKYGENAGNAYCKVTFTSTTPAALTGGTIGSNQSICYNVVPSTLTSVADAASGCAITYQWQSSTTSATGPWNNVGGNTKTLSFSPPGATTTTYYIRNATDNCGRTASSNVVTVTILPKPSNAGAITGPTSVCSGQTAVAYSIAAVANAATYNWLVPSGSTITSGQGTNSIVVTVGSTSGTIQVQPVNACGTGTYASANIAVNPGVPGASGSISGLTSVCAGQYAVVYSVSAVATAASYIWTVPSGATITSGTNTNSITVTFGSTAGAVTITPINGCGNAASATSLPISINPLPTGAGAISGSGSVCPNQTGIPYSIAAVANATSYSWSLPSGSTITSGAGTNSIVVTFGSVSGNVIATPVNTCGNGTASSKTVAVKSLTVSSSISGPTLVCGGTTGLKYSIPAVTGATGYTWTVPSGATITAGAGTRVITVTMGSISDNLTVTAFNSCGNAPIVSQAISVTNGVPSAAGTISGVITVCSGDAGVTYSIPAVSGATSYTWTVPSGTTITSGALTNSITVTYGSLSGNITAKGTNVCGSGSSSTSPITVNKAPISAGTITGSTIVCLGDATVYSVAAVSGATSYNWTVPSDATITSGVGTNSISVTFGSVSDNITVVTANTCGTGPAKSKAVTVNTIPADPSAIVGSSSVCAGQTGISYSISASSGATSYTWNLPAGYSITSGFGTNSIIVKLGAGAASGTISVIPSNTCGNSVGTSSLSITVSVSPSAVGAITGLTSVCKGLTSVSYSISAVTNATSYNWTVPTGAIVISGAGTTSIVVSYAGATVTSGSVDVDAINSCGTTSKSLAVTISATCQYVWSGTTSSDWSNTANWQYGLVPTSTTDVLIPSGTPNNPTLTAISNAQSITNNGIITFGSNILNVYGNITNNGTFNMGSSSALVFKGSIAQTLTGVSTVTNIEINNNAGVSIQSALTVKGTLSLKNGVLTTNSNVTVNFDNGGNIGYNVSDNGSVSGNVTGRRDVIARTHYICSPFDGVTSTQVDATTPLFFNGYWKMYTKTFATQGWAAVMDLTTSMPVGTGFSLAYPNASSLQLSGTYNHNLSFTTPGYSNVAAAKYILIGNPYPSTIDWSTIYNGGNAVNTGAAVYYWSAANNQVSTWISATGGTNGGTQYIPAMQAFMVATTGAVGPTSSVTINNSARVTNNSSYFRTGQTDNSIIKLAIKTSEGITDETLISLNSDATEEFEYDKDAYKIINSGFTPSLYTLTNTDATMYSINSLPFNDEQAIPLNLKVSKEGIYELHCKELTNQTGYTVLLEDKWNNTFLPVDTTLVYIIFAKPTDNVDRFVLRFHANLTTSVSLGTSKSIVLSTYDNNLMLTSNAVTAEGVEFKVYDAAGRLVQVITNQSINPGIKIIPLEKLTSGVYLIHFNVNSVPYTGKVVLK